MMNYYINSKMKYFTKCILVSLLILSLLSVSSNVFSFHQNKHIFHSIQHSSSLLVSTKNPYYSIISLPLACCYNNTTQFLNPFVLIENDQISSKQKEFLLAVKSNDNVISIGCNPSNYNTISYNGSPVSISQQIAKTYFQSSSQALILPYNLSINAYRTSLIASPLASYLHMPILLFDTKVQNHEEILQTLSSLNVTSLYFPDCINQTKYQKNFDLITLHNTSHIQNILLDTIKNKFNTLNYITITNPIDVISNMIKKEHTFSTEFSINHTALFLLGRKILLSGNDIYNTTIPISEGIQKVKIHVSLKNKTSIFGTNNVPVFLSATLTDPNGKTIAYGNSPGYSTNSTYLETIITNLSGMYTLNLSIFHGYKGGYFSLRGISNIKTEMIIDTKIATQSSPHYPLISDLSLNAAYLTSAHGGIIIADEQFALTDNNYTHVANQHAAGPWYDETLHVYNNQKVNIILDRLRENISLLKKYDLYGEYMNKSGWLALLGDTNMIPMYYFPSNQTHLVERGIPSDNPYSLNHHLSPGRIMSYTASDTSLLIGRTLFYKDVCGLVNENDSWHQTFHFVFGEGFGETGGFFHQIPYANTIESYGFETEVFGNFRNSRQTAERMKVYENTNFVEYLGHGDWFWFTPSIYGFNSIGKSIGSMDVREWDITRPNVVLTSACLMGRVDGVPPQMSIALSFLYAGSNAFVGATRETGQEAGLTVLEDHLILDDYSLGEALRGEKRVDKINPTYTARCLFGDPAFNPYDPLHGYSDQGFPFPSVE